MAIDYVFSGVISFRKDIEMMLGQTLMSKIAFLVFTPAWCFITPVCLLVSNVGNYFISKLKTEQIYVENVIF